MLEEFKKKRKIKHLCQKTKNKKKTCSSYDRHWPPFLKVQLYSRNLKNNVYSLRCETVLGSLYIIIPTSYGVFQLH